MHCKLLRVIQYYAYKQSVSSEINIVDHMHDQQVENVVLLDRLYIEKRQIQIKLSYRI